MSKVLFITCENKIHIYKPHEVSFLLYRQNYKNGTRPHQHLRKCKYGKYATRAPEVVLNAFYQFFYYFFVRKTLQTIKLNAIFFFTGSNKCGAGEDLLQLKITF